ncbi:MAG TPA: PDZ domain-containing protein [Planctomycetota bacterium]|nr:PDZ domain-containing protein [Planctomycetota bacterium]
MQRSSLLVFLGALGGILAFSSVAAIASVFWRAPLGAVASSRDDNEEEEAPPSRRVTRQVHSQYTFLGVSTETEDDRLVVKSVTLGTAAANAGIQEGDAILEIAGTPVRTSSDLSRTIRARRPGESVVILVRRGGETLELDATLGIDSRNDFVVGEPVKGGTLRGTVTAAETGKPIADAMVQTVVAGNYRFGGPSTAREATRTDASGRYELPIADSDSGLDLEVTASRFVDWRKSIADVAKGPMDAKLEADRRAHIHGTVRVAGSAKPASSFTLRVEKRGFMGVSARRNQQDFVDGRFELPLEIGTWTVRAWAAGDLSSKEEVVKVADEDVSVDLELAPSSGRR